MYIFISRCTSESTFKLLTSTLGIIHILIPLVLSNTYSLQCATPTKLKYGEFYTMLYTIHIILNKPKM